MFASILVYAPNWIGDAVMATPVFRSIKRKYPQTTLDVIARKPIYELLQGLKYIDEFIPLPDKPLQQGICALKLRPKHYSASIILPHSFRSALLSFLSGAEIRIGYDCNSRKMFLTHAVPFPKDENGNRKIQYMTYEYLKLCELINVSSDNLGLELASSEEEDGRWKQQLREQEITGPLLGISPGASFGPSKRWDTDRFAQVATELHQKFGAVPILITGPDEQDIREQFMKQCSTKVIDPFVHSHSLSRLKTVIKNLDLLICNDSGPRHIAVAFGIPVICVMGPTKPEYTESPWERGAIIRVPVECGPCQLPECPTDHRCMKLITSQMILEQTEKYLRSDE